MTLRGLWFDLELLSLTYGQYEPRSPNKNEEPAVHDWVVEEQI